jgi:hypothetical protein
MPLPSPPEPTDPKPWPFPSKSPVPSRLTRNQREMAQRCNLPPQELALCERTLWTRPPSLRLQ